MDVFLNLLNNTSVIIFVATIMIIAFARSIIKIFRMGVTFKNDVITRDEFRDFEAEMKQDMRGYAVQIQKLVSNSTNSLLDERLKDLDSIKKYSEDVKILKVEIDTKINMINSKYNELSSLVSDVKELSNKVQRLEYNQQVNSNVDRRTL